MLVYGGIGPGGLDRGLTAIKGIIHSRSEVFSLGVDDNIPRDATSPLCWPGAPVGGRLSRPEKGLGVPAGESGKSFVSVGYVCVWGGGGGLTQLPMSQRGTGKLGRELLRGFIGVL